VDHVRSSGTLSRPGQGDFRGWRLGRLGEEKKLGVMAGIVQVRDDKRMSLFLMCIFA